MEILDNLLALLFVADSPISSPALAVALEVTEGQVEQGLELLAERFTSRGPLQLVRLAEGYQLSTKPEYSPLISNFLKPRRQKLTRSLLEILAIVAYRQPITVAEIDAVRGVQSDHGIRSLAERRLVQDVGRKHAAGRPILYGTTNQFLHAFNLNHLSDLPVLKLENEQESALASLTSETGPTSEN